MAREIKHKAPTHDINRAFSHVVGSGFDISINELKDQLSHKGIADNIDELKQYIIKLGSTNKLKFLEHGGAKGDHFHVTLM